MTPNNGAKSLKAEMNEWVETSRWLGICSLLPYLLLGILSYVDKGTDQPFFFHAENVLGLLCVFWGIIFGPVTLIAGILAIKQIYSSKNAEKGILSAILGTVFGLLAIVSNIVTVFMIVAPILHD